MKHKRLTTNTFNPRTGGCLRFPTPEIERTTKVKFPYRGTLSFCQDLTFGSVSDPLLNVEFPSFLLKCDLSKDVIYKILFPPVPGYQSFFASVQTGSTPLVIPIDRDPNTFRSSRELKINEPFGSWEFHSLIEQSLSFVCDSKYIFITTNKKLKNN